MLKLQVKPNFPSSDSFIESRDKSDAMMPNLYAHKKYIHYFAKLHKLVKKIRLVPFHILVFPKCEKKQHLNMFIPANTSIFMKKFLHPFHKIMKTLNDLVT